MFKVVFDPKISLGNVLTIIGGIVAMMVWVMTLTEKFADYDKRIELAGSKIEEVSRDVVHVKEIQKLDQTRFSEFREQYIGDLRAIDTKLDRLIQRR